MINQPVMSAPTPPPQTSGLETPESAPPEQYAVAAMEAHESSPERPSSKPRRVLEFLSSSAQKMWKVFQEADLLGKTAMVGGGLLMAAAANKIIDKITGINIVEKGVSLFRATWDKIAGVGDSLGEGLEEVRGFSIKKTIAILLGGSALVALFANMDEIKELWDEANAHPEGLLAGLKAGIAARFLSGALDISDERWDELAKKYPFIPSRETRDAARGVVDDAKESLGNVMEGLDVGLTKFKEFLSPVTTRMFSYLDEKFPGWKEDPTMKAIVMLKEQPQKIAEFLSLDSPEKVDEFLAEAKAHGAGTARVGGASFLIHRLLDTPYAGLISGANMALYMLFQNEAVDTALVKGFEVLHRAAGFVHHQMQTITTKMGLKPEWLMLQDEGFGVKSMMDYLFLKMEEHPDLTALTILNVGVIKSKVILSFLKDALFFIVDAGKEAIGFMIEHTTTSGIMLALGGLTFIERRQVIEDLSWALYPDDFDERKKFKEEVLGFLDKTDFTRVSDNPTTTEAALMPIYDRLVQDPIEFFSDPDNQFALYDLTKDHHIEWHGIEFGKTVTIGFLSGVNPVNNAVRIEWNTFEAMMDEWAARGITMENLNVYGTHTGEMVIGGAAIYGAARSLLFLFDDFNGSTGNFARFLRANFHPFSAEFRQVIKGMVRSSADALTVSEATQIMQGMKLHRVSAELEGIFRVVESGYELPGGRAAFKAAYESGEGGFLSRLQQGLSDGLKVEKVQGILSAETFDPILHKASFLQYKANLDGLISRLVEVNAESGRIVGTKATGLVHYGDKAFIHELRGLASDVDKLLDHIKALEEAKTPEAVARAKVGIAESLDVLKQDYVNSQTRWSRAFRRAQRFFDESALGRSRGRVAPVEGPRPLPEFKTDLMRRYAAKAIELKIAPETLLEIEKLRLTEPQLKQFLSDVKGNPALSAQAYEVLVNTRYPYSAAIVRSLQRGAPLAFALTVTYGFSHAENPVEFLTHEGPRIAAAFPAMKYADQTVGNKMPHPLLRLGVDLLAGAGAAVGAGAFFDHVVMEPVSRHFPNWNNPDTWFSESLRDWFYIAGMALPVGPVFDYGEWALESAGIGDGVKPKTDPLDYLFDTVRRVRAFGEEREEGTDESIYFSDDRVHTSGDLEENAAESAVKWEEKIEKTRRRLQEMQDEGSDSSDKGYRRLSLKLERFERELIQLERMRDGLWIRDVQLDISQQDLFINILKIAYVDLVEEQFPDRGQVFVDTLYSRIGSSENLVDGEDKDIWQFLMDHEDLPGPDGSRYSFRKWIALVAYYKMRRSQMKELGFSPDLPEGYFDGQKERDQRSDEDPDDQDPALMDLSVS